MKIREKFTALYIISISTLLALVPSTTSAERYLLKRSMAGSPPECVDSRKNPVMSISAAESALAPCYRKKVSSSVVQLVCDGGKTNLFFYDEKPECMSAIMQSGSAWKERK